jgi:hypothetical protein
MPGGPSFASLWLSVVPAPSAAARHRGIALRMRGQRRGRGVPPVPSGGHAGPQPPHAPAPLLRLGGPQGSPPFFTVAGELPDSY